MLRRFLALYLALASDYYGGKNSGINYRIGFTAHGAGSVLGPTMASYFKTFSGSYLPAFYISKILALLGILLTIILNGKAKHKRRVRESVKTQREKYEP